MSNEWRLLADNRRPFKKKAPTPSSQGDFDCRGRQNGERVSTGGKWSLCVHVCEDYEAGHTRSFNSTLGQTGQP